MPMQCFDHSFSVPIRHGEYVAYFCIFLQPLKYQLSNSQVSDNSKSVVKDKKLTVHNSYPGAI